MPETAGADLQACGREANQNSVTIVKTKAKTSRNILGPKKASEAVSERPISFLGSMPLGPPSLILRTNARVREFGYECQ